MVVQDRQVSGCDGNGCLAQRKQLIISLPGRGSVWRRTACWWSPGDNRAGEFTLPQATCGAYSKEKSREFSALDLGEPCCGLRNYPSGLLLSTKVLVSIQNYTV